MAWKISSSAQTPVTANSKWPHLYPAKARASSLITEAKAEGGVAHCYRRSGIKSSSNSLQQDQRQLQQKKGQRQRQRHQHQPEKPSAVCGRGGGGEHFSLQSPLESAATRSQSSDSKSYCSSSFSCSEEDDHRYQQYHPASADPVADCGTARNSGTSFRGRTVMSEGGGLGASGGGSGGKHAKGQEITLNLSVSIFPELAFLAQGTMCKCFVARSNPLSASPVVLKMAIENGPREAERDLNRELALLQNLSHPNLAGLLGAGLTPKGKTFIVMEYLEGGTLRRRLDVARGGLGFWPAARHALELASAMKYLHEDAIPGTCVMHRDLKPDNVGFSGNVIKLFDLGLAKLIRKSESGVNDFYRMSGEVGSLRYMSPEVASLQPYNEKADVHSFGVVMWELVTGWLPFSGLSPDQYMFQVVQHGQRPLMQFGWDPAFKMLLASCWAEDPRERPSFSEIHDTLGTLVTEREPAAASSSSRLPLRSEDNKSKPSPKGFAKGGGLLFRVLSSGKSRRKPCPAPISDKR